MKYIRCSPYHSSSNRLAERFIGTFKAAMKAGRSDQVPLSQRHANFLLGYCSTPHSTTDRTPSQLFLNRELHTRLDLLKPNVTRDVAKGQASQKYHHDKSAKAIEFQVGQAVWVRDVLKKQWVKGKIAETSAPYSYKVHTEDGKLWRRHVDQLKDHQIIVKDSVATTSSPSEDAFVSYRNELQLLDLPSSTQQAVPHYPQRARHSTDRLTY